MAANIGLHGLTCKDWHGRETDVPGQASDAPLRVHRRNSYGEDTVDPEELDVLVDTLENRIRPRTAPTSDAWRRPDALPLRFHMLALR